MVCYHHACLTKDIILPQAHKSMVTTQNQWSLSGKCDMLYVCGQIQVVKPEVCVEKIEFY